MKYFLSFIEEAVMNPRYEGYTAGRLEIYDDANGGPYALREVRFFTRDQDGFSRFRNKWDFKTVSEKRLAGIEAEIKLHFYDLSKRTKP